MDTVSRYKCKYCQKEFKHEKHKDNHELKQLCIPKEKRTYCSVCNISFSTVNELKFHYLDINHIDKLNNNKPDLLTINNNMYNADPYLNKNDIKVINNSIIGENLTIIYKNNTIEKLSTKTECNKHSELEEETITNYEVSNKSTNYQDIINNKIFNKPRLTERQTKIFKYLSLQSTNVNNAISKFKLILSKIDLNDANFFASHLRESTLIELKYKQLFGKYLDHFINALINKYNNGEDIFNNMNIMDFVTKLTK